MPVIRVLSDIHLEHRGHFELPRDPTDIICLCGDIGDPSLPSYRTFLEHCAEQSRMYTFVIMGNHEAYGKTLKQTSNIIQSICEAINRDIRADKIVFLNNTAFDIPGSEFRILGTTLWSDIHPKFAWHIRNSLSDFSRIKDWSIGAAKEAYDHSLMWLRGQLQEAWLEDKKVVVMSHHAPLLSLGRPKHLSSSLQSAFASDLSDLIQEYTHLLKFWFYGHNHHSQKVTMKDTVIASNQIGYGGEEDTFIEEDTWNAELTFQLR